MSATPDGEPHWFEEIADHLGPAYLRYSFTKGTDQEVDFLIDALGLLPGERVLDLGCGPGRHAALLCERGYDVTGADRDPVAVAHAAQQVSDFEVVGVPGRQRQEQCVPARYERRWQAGIPLMLGGDVHVVLGQR